MKHENHVQTVFFKLSYFVPDYECVFADTFVQLNSEAHKHRISAFIFLDFSLKI